MERLTLVVQTFIKSDTVQDLCASLVNCFFIDRVRLIFWSDSATGSRKEAEHATLQPLVMQQLREFAQASGHLFESVEIHENPANLGTCKTCEVALDYAFQADEFVVFVEDDVIFARDALVWFFGIRESGLLRRDEIWAVTGESIFFDARNRQLPPTQIADSVQAVTAQGLTDNYTFHKFVPSTCFATTRAKWQEFGATRGQPTGDVDVCRRCEAEGKFCAFPVVPRIKDTGMLHELGYSVMLHSKENVAQHNKNTYLLSDMIPRHIEFSPEMFKEFKGDGGLLFRQSTLLEGFGPLG